MLLLREEVQVFMNYKEEYDRWIRKKAMDNELKKLTEQEIRECFYKELSFGTGGIRAVMGPGPNRLNIYTIRKTTEGYARYIDAHSGKAVVIAYDNRNHSKEFALEAAKVLAAHDIHVYLFKSLRTTPELSFAVRHLKTFGGIIITASHNPPEYNGYKIYDSRGCQCVPRDTDEIKKYINSVKNLLDINVQESFDNIEIIGTEVDEAYYEALLSVQEQAELEKRIKIVYTPLHGAGYMPVTTMLRRLGYEFFEVEKQCNPDGDFTNTESPNPENKRAFDCAIELAKEVDADLIIATDPDCDRIGLVVAYRGEYIYLTGNQTGVILLFYLLSQKTVKGTMPENPIVFNTIVTSDLGTRICEKYGVEIENTLTGFKFIGDKIREYEGKKTFIFGYEESYGCLIKDFTRDKDGVQASILAAEAANFYNKHGLTLVDVLNNIYDEFGYCEDAQESETFLGIEGERKMSDLIDVYRYGDIKFIEGRRVIAREDYLNSIRMESDGNTKSLTLPKSDVVKMFLEDNSWVAIRPSGNEPKVKYYKNLWKGRN